MRCCWVAAHAASPVSQAEETPGDLQLSCPLKLYRSPRQTGTDQRVAQVHSPAHGHLPASRGRARFALLHPEGGPRHAPIPLPPTERHCAPLAATRPSGGWWLRSHGGPANAAAGRGQLGEAGMVLPSPPASVSLTSGSVGPRSLLSPRPLPLHA